jgi:hypothetical protein
MSVLIFNSFISFNDNYQTSSSVLLQIKRCALGTKFSTGLVQTKASYNFLRNTKEHFIEKKTELVET